MKSGLLYVITLGLLLGTGCKTRQKGNDQEVVQEYYDDEVVDSEPEVSYPYRPSTTKTFNLLHTRLDLAFDWSKQEVNGKAYLKMKPWFHPASEVVLDAKGMVVHSVSRKEGTDWVPLRHAYDLRKLKVNLDRNFSRNQDLELQIVYTARPNGLDTLLPESAEERGIYFINPDGKSRSKPMQIWTQGETHGSSVWFPTFDQPNIRCTQEMYITVPDSFVTLSNGLLTGSSLDGSGYRTDHWEMKLPHAPYLFMLTVGRFSKVSETWRGKEVSYYVEPKYEPYARLIFGKTPEMLEFFSNRLGVEYPWEKYAQIVVRDFVAGAMENTTATIHYERVQHDAREHLDDSQEDLISHELFHHWFGDLVTCESWANLTLNEGFASYGEYLWKEYKYGRDAADHHLANDRRDYLAEATMKMEPLIRYHHNLPDDMFDGHSYQKGACVLHMLRDYLGDAVFFESLKQYLTKHAYSDVEVAELRMAFEDVSGQDLSWFFDQWFLREGHPQLEVVHQPVNDGSWTVGVRQLFAPDAEQHYRFPVRMEVFQGAVSTTREFWVETVDTTFVLSADGAPIDNVAFDKDRVLLADLLLEEKPASAWRNQLVHYGNGMQALQAIEYLPFDEELGDTVVNALAELTRHPFYAVRKAALDRITYLPESPKSQNFTAVFLSLADDVHPEVRALAATAIGSMASSAAKPDSTSQLISALQRLCRDSSYEVQSSALVAMGLVSKERQAEEVKLASKDVSSGNVMVVTDLLRRVDPKAALELSERFLSPEYEQSTRWAMMRGLRDMIHAGLFHEEASSILKKTAKEDEDWWIRFAALNALFSVRDKVTGLRSFFEERKAVEQEPMVQSMLEKYLSEQW